MYEFTPTKALVTKISKINRGDRWTIYRRLQELQISCWCPEDGTLWVEIDDCTHAVLLRSTIQRFVNSRSELTDWLERCWSTNVLSISNN